MNARRRPRRQRQPASKTSGTPKRESAVHAIKIVLVVTAAAAASLNSFRLIHRFIEWNPFCNAERVCVWLSRFVHILCELGERASFKHFSIRRNLFTPFYGIPNFAIKIVLRA